VDEMLSPADEQGRLKPGEVDEGDTPFTRYALCLSGGGLRATFFHLGVIRALRNAGRLTGATHIFSVSGGSILAAHLALHWQKYTGTDEQFDDACHEIMSVASRDIRNNIVCRWLLARLFPPLWLKMSSYGPTRLLESEYSNALFGRKTFF
jgi:hypothetical protein